MKSKEILNLVLKRQEEEKLIVGKIGATIKLKRKGKNQTLNSLSELAGVSISYLSKIENDLLKPNIDYLSNVLEDLEINEEFLNESTQMNKWYLRTIKNFLNIKDYNDDLKGFISERDDFQSKLIEFCLLVKEGKLSNITKIVNLLLQNVNVMHKTELYIFILSLCHYYVKIENHFSAGELLKRVEKDFLYDSLLNLWYLEIKHELAINQRSFVYYEQTSNELLKQYFLFNLEDKIKELRERKVQALAYFLEPDNFKDYLDDEEMYKSYRLSHIYFKKFEAFNKLNKKDDLAQLLFDEINGNYSKVEKGWSKVEYREDALELAIKEYFKYKYDHNKSKLFLKESLFANSGLNQNYFACYFIAELLINGYSSEHKYKQCYIVSERKKELNNLRRLYLEI